MQMPTLGAARVKVATWSDLGDRSPAYALVAGVDLVVIRFDDQVSVMFGRCHHRGALLADGRVEGPNLICGVHGWDYRYDTGVSEYNNDEALHRFSAEIDVDEDVVWVDESEVETFAETHPQPFRRDEYLGLYQDIHGTPEEPYNGYIQSLARDGLSLVGHHGAVSAMGVALTDLPLWDDVQLLTAQLATRPLMDSDPVESELVIGPGAAKPLHLDIPLFVSDMSFGALSAEAKVALATGAELAGTGICSGEGGMLPEEQEANSRYFYELASARFGWSLDKVAKCQAFHFKGGQGAKTGTGGHLPPPGHRGRLPGGGGRGPRRNGGDPHRVQAVGATHRGRHRLRPRGGVRLHHPRWSGGATGAAPEIFKQNISVPTMAALPRARRHLDTCGAGDVTLIITGGLRTESDFVKALALGADGVAISNSALQAIGCLGMRACHTNNCPVGIATQQKGLRARLIVEDSARRLQNYLTASVELMKVLARACGHDRLSGFNVDDLTTWKRDMADLTGVAYGGVSR